MEIKLLFRDKKGIFFTLAAITLSIVIIFSFKAVQPKDLKDQTDVIAIRINTMNNFIKDVEQDLENGLYIASFRAFASMAEFINEEGSFISDIEGSLNELVLQGTLEDTSLSLMQDSTFTDWTEKIQTQASKIGIIVNFTLSEIKINQTSPWSVIVETNVNLIVTDEKNTSSWNRSKTIISEVGIENLEDPLYIVNSNGRVTNQIIRTPITDFVQGSDVSNLLTHANNSYYIASNESPDFLMRLQGILDNSSLGIESLVNLGEFQDQGLVIKDKSIVDHVYFSSKSVTSHWINGTPSWFKIDTEHLETYEVQGLI